MNIYLVAFLMVIIATQTFILWLYYVDFKREMKEKITSVKIKNNEMEERIYKRLYDITPLREYIGKWQDVYYRNQSILQMNEETKKVLDLLLEKCNYKVVKNSPPQITLEKIKGKK